MFWSSRQCVYFSFRERFLGHIENNKTLMLSTVENKLILFALENARKKRAISQVCPLCLLPNRTHFYPHGNPKQCIWGPGFPGILPSCFPEYSDLPLSQLFLLFFEPSHLSLAPRWWTGSPNLCSSGQDRMLRAMFSGLKIYIWFVEQPYSPDHDQNAALFLSPTAL